MLTGRHLAPTAVVFDLDGTLIDSRGDIAAAANHALLASGRSPLPVGKIATFVGDGARALLAQASALPETAAELDGLLEAYISYYTAHPTDFTKWVDGAEDTLDRVAAFGLPLCICTNKARPVTDAVLTALGARSRFRLVHAGGDSPEKKPEPGPLLWLAAELGVEPQSLVMVGDGPQDVECARSAGCRVLGVASEYTPRARLEEAKPDLLLDGIREVPEVVRRWCDATVRLKAIRLS